MDWKYYFTKGARLIFWAEILLFMLMSVPQLLSADSRTLVYVIPLACVFLYAPALATFVTTVGVREREFEEERRAVRAARRGKERRNAPVRSKGQPRRK